MDFRKLIPWLPLFARAPAFALLDRLDSMEKRLAELEAGRPALGRDLDRDLDRDSTVKPPTTSP
jgi:hypothetical protein